MKTVWKTFQQWSSEGYTINKGSKAKWIDGVPKFHSEQVSMRFSKSKDSIYEDNVGDDFDTWGMDAMEWGDN